jgi:CRP-like cAMP-binding protein
MKLKTFLLTLVPLDESEMNYLSPLIKTETFEKGSFYIKWGQLCNKVSFINEGLFKMLMIDNDGKEKIIDFLGASQFVTDYISFLNRKPTDCEIVALKSSIVESINFTDLQKIYEHTANFQKIGRLLAEQNFIRFAERIKNLTMPPQERYRILCENSNLVQDVPQYMIASYLGVSAEWLSKIRSKE